ncbi:hypothetical protein REPUB_Repub05bG0078800 [Reevesia pubescens]
MDVVDPEAVFRDYEDDPGNEFLQKDQKDETHFHTAVSCIAESLKTQIISRSYDEVAICFFNTVPYLVTFSPYSSMFLGAITWLDSVTNRPLKIERSLICEDTGALIQEPPKHFQTYRKFAYDIGMILWGLGNTRYFFKKDQKPFSN